MAMNTCPRQDYANAMADFDKAIQLDPKQAYAFSNRGRLYQAKNEYERAVQGYTKAIQLDPRRTADYRGRGYIFYLMGFTDLAMADLDRAIELAPGESSDITIAAWQITGSKIIAVPLLTTVKL